MANVAQFCRENDISVSARGGSYYFDLDGKKYRVSDHTVESSNAGAWCEDYHTGEMLQVRPEYHPGGREDDVTYIFAAKHRIIEIYSDLRVGYELDGRGRRKKT